MKSKKFYVYYLKTNDNELIYVGKGSGKRMYKHVEIANGNSINRSKNPKLYNKISFVFKNGGYVFPEIIFESEIEQECHDKEVKLIEEIGLKNLCNLTPGGEGTSGYKLSDKTRQKMSDYWKGKKSNSSGKTRTDEFKENCRERMSGNKNMLGKKHSEETKEKMSQSKKGKPKGAITEKRRLAIIDGIKKKKLEKFL